ncbi:YbdD/YjiX family protein [Streptomyces alkaliterrae]|uniref:Putative selenoprotein n=1 Tax=Streptomyces alkaliterrae TaxID=2213162 RepID=A0A5P0YLU1_9ACTN|nr:YbdD/YjiX family protein [Streptomyces alkaliterrae]MBB1252466.1 YbdD/YjiX family protein [Streptomyces alkaliterrae]MBB1258652.1 YbdD/YjiX family protein [Streptomyces alkaliterrae]MQS00597.1 putative selenoprotein [Streptomyces alkaliterrae]
MRHAARLRALAARVRWFWREATGEAAYDRYVAHARRNEPGAAVLSRREFERRRTDAREADPREGFRCC